MERMTVFNEKVIPFGIDLGTTNCCITAGVGSTAKVIKLKNGKETFPSCVMWDGYEFITGEVAYRNRHRENVIYSVKRYMQNPKKKIVLREGDKTISMTPAEVSAEILKGLVHATGGMYGDVKDVVVTVPAYFNQVGVSETKKACELAGLNCVGILREPTSASLAYKIDKDADVDRILVYDLGGGTFDISLLEVSHKPDSELYELYNIAPPDDDTGTVINVIAIDGDSRLGGDDYDLELFKILQCKLKDFGIDDSDLSREDKEKLIYRLEQIKKTGVEFTHEMKILIDCGKSAKIIFTPDDFVEGFISIYEKTKKCIDSVLRRTNGKVDTIALVGGSTKNPILYDLLGRDYPHMRINNSLNPDKSVAIGAGIQASNILLNSGNVKVFDVLPLSIGVLADGSIDHILARDSQLPVSSCNEFTTLYDNQTYLEVELYQGNSIIKDLCTKIGVIRIDDIRPAKKGVMSVYVSLSVSTNHLLNCSVVVHDTEFDTKEERDISIDLNVLSSDKQDRLLEKIKRAADKLDEKDKNKVYEMINNQVDVDEIKQFVRKVRGKNENR